MKTKGTDDECSAEVATRAVTSGGVRSLTGMVNDEDRGVASTLPAVSFATRGRGGVSGPGGQSR